MSRDLSNKNMHTTLIHLIFILFCITCIIPIIVIVSISLSSKTDIIYSGYRLFPLHIDLEGYKFIFNNPKQILDGYMITILVTVAGTIVSLFVNALIAYPLSRKEFRYRNTITYFIFFPTLFSGGMVPWYILISQYLNMKNNILVLILPYIASAWNTLLLRTYFAKIPVALFESAKIDGANEFLVFYKILLPLAKPAMATVGFLTALVYWNDWWLAMLFIEEEKLMPLQFLLQRIMSNIQYLTSGVRSNAKFDISKLPDESARMAMCVLAAGPMLFIFQFFQKYFVKGLTVGSIKG